MFWTCILLELISYEGLEVVSSSLSYQINSSKVKDLLSPVATVFYLEHIDAVLENNCK